MRRWAIRVWVAAACVSAGWAPLSLAAQERTALSDDPFLPIEADLWPMPNGYRSASGVPGPAYWQQQVDYSIRARLDEPTRSITGSATIRYRNNSPDRLDYLWLLLDQNIYRNASLGERSRTTRTDTVTGRPETEPSRRLAYLKSWQGGFTITKVTDGAGRPLTHRVVDTLMRVDLAQAVAAGGGETVLVVEWRLPLMDRTILAGPTGQECFTGPGGDGNCIFQAGQWFPRLAAYSDYEGWHTQPYLRRGEFPLEFGDYRVALTVPADHVVAATGALQNPQDVLTAEQRRRLTAARSADAPVFVVTPEEAVAAERARAPGERTWVFEASRVRDFAWASSRKYVWDAMGVRQEDGGAPVMAMSFYPKEAQPLWDGLSTRAIAHTIRSYNRWAFPYPYPVAQSVNGPVGGMEFPMISFNHPRPERTAVGGEANVSEQQRRGLASLVMHEVGHNYFPMIVNSDERRWAWMDEGITAFLQYQNEQLWQRDFPSRRGRARDAVDYMASADQQALMTPPDSIRHFFPTIYVKPAAAFSVLREVVLGPEAFDRALREYAIRWRFKRPTPADLFRTFEESSGVDLDWFWRGWFYTTDHVDIALRGVTDQSALAGAAARHLYRFDFRNVGGLVMPVDLTLRYADGGEETVQLPAQIWRYDRKQALWDLATDRVLVGAEIDQPGRSGDTDRANNRWTVAKPAPRP